MSFSSLTTTEQASYVQHLNNTRLPDFDVWFIACAIMTAELVLHGGDTVYPTWRLAIFVNFAPPLLSAAASLYAAGVRGVPTAEELQFFTLFNAVAIICIQVYSWADLIINRYSCNSGLDFSYRCFCRMLLYVQLPLALAMSLYGYFYNIKSEYFVWGLDLCWSAVLSEVIAVGIVLMSALGRVAVLIR